MYRLRGMGATEIDDPIVGYAKLLQGQGIGGEFTQRALIEATNIYNRRNVGNTLQSDRTALASGGMNALISALSNLGTVSSTHVDTWDQAQAGGTGTTVDLSTMRAQTVIAPAPVVPVPSTTVTPAQNPPPLSPTIPTQPNPQIAQVAGFDFKAIPLWAWAGAAGLALYSFGGGKKRR